MGGDLVDAGVVTRAVRLACRAPSLHNSQPWRWVVDRKGLHLYLDRDRIVRATDRSGHEALLSCGAVLDHLRVVMAAAGWSSHVERFPDAADRDYLAAIRFSRADDVTVAQRRRADAILLRRTDRLPFDAPPEWVPLERQLRTSIGDLEDTEDGRIVRLDVVTAAVRPRLAQASLLTESMRRHDPSYHVELSWWTVTYKLTDGIPRGSLVSVTERERVDVARSFPATGPRERRPEVSEDHSVIAVLSTTEDTAAAALRCGEALSATLLEATMAGLSTCPLTHITELPDSRAVVAALIGQPTTPQVLIRIGRAPTLGDIPTPTPRRPVEEVLQVRL